MSNVTFKIASVDAPLPAGKRDGQWQYKLTDKATGAVVNRFVTPDSQVEFPGVGVGTYTMTVNRLDSNGGDLGTPASVDFEVVASVFPQPIIVSIVSIV